MVYIETYIFDHFYQLYLVLLTMVPRNSSYETTVSVCGGTGMDARIVYIRGFVYRGRRFVFCNQCE